MPLDLHAANVVSESEIVLEPTSMRHLHAGEVDVDLAANTVTVDGTPVRGSRLEFELLVTFAGDPCWSTVGPRLVADRRAVAAAVTTGSSGSPSKQLHAIPKGLDR